MQYPLYTRHTAGINVASAIYQVWARQECSTYHLTRHEASINVMLTRYQREKTLWSAYCKPGISEVPDIFQAANKH